MAGAAARYSDPETGNTYDCSMQLEEGGSKLVVRGFMGISALGRSQVRLRRSVSASGEVFRRRMARRRPP